MYTNKNYFLTKIKQEDLDNLVKDDAGTPQMTYLDAAIASADDKINSYLRKVLKTLPVPDEKVTDTIKQCSYDIAMYNLHDRIQFGDIPERVKEKYDNTIAWLKSVSKRETETGILEETETSGINYSSNGTVFNRNSF